MPSDRRLEARDGGLGCPDASRNFGLRKAGIGTRSEEFVKKLEFLGEPVVLPLYVRTCQRSGLELSKLFAHL